MTEYVDLDVQVLASVYDDEHEEWQTKAMTVREYLRLGCEQMPPVADVRPTEGL